jgi:hypothetical protein
MSTENQDALRMKLVPGFNPGLTFQSPVVTILPAGFAFKRPTCCPRNEVMCFD